MDVEFISKEEVFIELELLRLLSEKEVLQLSDIAGTLGILEVEIIKLLNKLRENYIVIYDGRSIKWVNGDNPAKIKPWGWNYVYRALVGSTMVSAKHYPPWSIVLAEHQLKAYGRHGKQWISNLGGIWMTLKFEAGSWLIQILPIAVPVIICDFLHNKLGIKAGIKWPNDIIVDEKKLAGFLVEGETSVSDKVIIYLGIGLNVNNDPPIETAISLKTVLNRLVPRNSIIAYIAGNISRIESKIRDTKDIRKLQIEYLDRLETLGRKVRALTRHGEIIGIAKTITDIGDLVVETDTGSFRLSSGDVLELRHLK
ncbi:MAG: biotin--[acetyl-CoA-carboxylase] ligase [Desulfurococcaceae archaeon]